jgi:hypothetical protein
MLYKFKIQMWYWLDNLISVKARNSVNYEMSFILFSYFTKYIYFLYSQNLDSVRRVIKWSIAPLCRHKSSSFVSFIRSLTSLLFVFIFNSNKLYIFFSSSSSSSSSQTCYFFSFQKFYICHVIFVSLWASSHKISDSSKQY